MLLNEHVARARHDKHRRDHCARRRHPALSHAAPPKRPVGDAHSQTAASSEELAMHGASATRQALPGPICTFRLPCPHCCVTRPAQDPWKMDLRHRADQHEWPWPRAEEAAPNGRGSSGAAGRGRLRAHCSAGECRVPRDVEIGLHASVAMPNSACSMLLSSL